MKKILFYLVVALFLVACAKEANEPIQEEPIQEETDQDILEWNYPPASLPENIDQILAETPLWITCRGKMYAKVKDGKITVVEPDALLDGEYAFFGWSFTESGCTVYYINSSILKPQTWTFEWNKQKIIDYNDGIITLTLADSWKLLGYPGLVPIHSIRPATQQEYDKVMNFYDKYK